MNCGELTGLDSTLCGKIEIGYFEHDGRVIKKMTCKAIDSDELITVCAPLVSELVFIIQQERLMIEQLEHERLKGVIK